MASRIGTPADIIVNGSRNTLLPSPPSTVSSVVPPDWPVSPPQLSPQLPSKTSKRKKRQQRPQSVPSLPAQQSTVFSPRPAQDLLVERSYLVASLAWQGAYSANLIQRLSIAEQALASSAEVGRRRLRKQIALLRSKIAVAAEQEKAIIVRLGELYVEMQSRERWSRARSQTLHNCPFPVVPPSNALLEPGTAHETSPSLVLSPLSPEFVPSWMQEGKS